jgi:L-amino acid N-acyltransferase YncA
VTLLITSMTPGDWPAVQAIYAEGIATGLATFETVVPEWASWDQAHLTACRLVARREGQVLAWAGLSGTSSRAVYAGVAEVSLYVAADTRRQGVGRTLLEALIAESERAGFWTLQATIFAENDASLNLHAGAGFRVVGRRERIGLLHGVWHDTIVMERRSPIIGV